MLRGGMRAILRNRLSGAFQRSTEALACLYLRQAKALSRDIQPWRPTRLSTAPTTCGTPDWIGRYGEPQLKSTEGKIMLTRGQKCSIAT